MSSVKELKNLLTQKGILDVNSANHFHALKDRVNRAREMRIPRSYELYDGPYRKYEKTTCGSYKDGGYELSTNIAGLNSMTAFVKALPDLKNSTKEVQQNIYACNGHMVTSANCLSRVACSCDLRTGCDCQGDCSGKVSPSCKCKNRCACEGRTTPECQSRTACACNAETLQDTTPLCSCDSVTTYY